jgi:peptidoglycan/LPS O-acetylase OafA/YrhL
MRKTATRNQAMDFLRSCAVLFVVTAHAELAHVGPSGDRYFGMGGTGVDLFFVLSGYLLGHQLFSELRETGRIDVGRFWIRRWMRTLPAYYVMLSLTTLWLIARQKTALISPSYFVFLQNYLTDLPYYSITWSLCVEEHFYLAIAPALLLSARHRAAGWLVAAFFLILPLACRSMSWYGSPDETHVRWDGCALGVLIALAKVWFPDLWGFLAKLAPALATVGLLAFLQAGLARIYPTKFLGIPDPIAWSLIYGSWVLLANSSPFWSERFRVVGARYLAERSYAVYLLHPEILALSRRMPSLPFPLHLAATVLLSLAVAEILFRFVERPINELREKLAASRSRDRPEVPASVADVNPA